MFDTRFRNGTDIGADGAAIRICMISSPVWHDIDGPGAAAFCTARTGVVRGAAGIFLCADGGEWDRCQVVGEIVTARRAVITRTVPADVDKRIIA